jgi:hypothetical protein
LYNREEHTIVVELESGELISAFLNSYLQNAMQIHDAQVGDSILIAFFGVGLNKRHKSFIGF